jgi:hypothetical protein
MLIGFNALCGALAAGYEEDGQDNWNPRSIHESVH